MESSQAIIIFGNIGSDAGYWYLGADGKIHHVPGWNPDTKQAFATIEKNLAILQRNAVHANPVQVVNEGINSLKQGKI